jgi:hypothetical protein
MHKVFFLQLFGLLLFGAGCPFMMTAQTTPPPFSVGLRSHYGFIIPHSRDIANVSKSRPFGMEINIGWADNNAERIQNSGVIARRGFMAYYMNYDNPEVLGYSICAAPFIEPMIRPDRRLWGSIQMGLGLSYLSTVFDSTDNPTNLFFSTRLSFLLMTNAYLHYRLHPHWDVSLGFNYNHISNGGMKNPNKGMNFPTYNLGVAYTLNPQQLPRPVKNKDWRALPRWYAYMQAAGSIKTVEATVDYPEHIPKWLLGGIVVAGRRVGRLNALAVGTEWIRDGWARTQLDRQNRNSVSALRGGLLFGHELLAGRVRFSVLMGAYLFNPAGAEDPVYQRYVLSYRIGRHVMLSSSLKAHRHVAEVFDLRVGYLW